MAASTLKEIGIREFRESIAEYVRADKPLAITRHGLTLGYYIPAKRSPSEADKTALQEATRRLHDLLEAQGIDPEDLIADFKETRKRRKRG
jgi:PHD/YefM family antitoxin component YafN of YafNO toxin-antitoxin module